MYCIKNDNNEVVFSGFPNKGAAREYRQNNDLTDVFICRSSNHPLGESNIPEKAKPKFQVQTSEAPVTLDEDGIPVTEKLTDEQIEELASAYPAIGTMGGGIPIWKS